MYLLIIGAAIQLLMPQHTNAIALFQSSDSQTDEILVYTPRSDGYSWFNNSIRRPHIKLGVWDREDYTITASTTIHLWSRWNAKVSNILDVIVRASQEGDPFLVSTTTARISYIPPRDSYYRLRVTATSTMNEYVIPGMVGQTIHMGEEIWAFLYPSYASYGANHWMGGKENLPLFQICDHECTTAPVPTTTPDCTSSCFSNVLFLPGIESSRLYRPQVVGDPENRVWEPSEDDDVRDLYLKENGEGWRDDVYTKEGDVLDELPVVGQNIYKSFISKMDELKEDGLINDWLPAAYDWRLSLGEILSNGNNVDGKIYYSGDMRATSTPYIIQELRRLAATSKSGKVTIIAHSNGGLLAKQLTYVLGDEAEDLIDKMIFVAVPQAGTPMAIAAGLHGYDQDIGPGGFILSSEVARSFASTSPMFYHLLPSQDYFSYVDTPVIQFDPALSEWTSRYGQTIDSKTALDEFLADSYGRVDAETGDTDQPVQLKSTLLVPAGVLHDELDNWAPPGDIELIQIAGWGVPTTVSGITYKKKGDGVKPEPTTTIDGDGTVVVPSALWASEATGAMNYWFDLDKYNRPFNRLITGRLKPVNHATILDLSEINNLVADTVTDSVQALDQYTYFSLTSPSSDEKRLRYTLHSPLTLSAYDNNGNHTGVSTTTGQIEEQIPGSYYMEFGETKYLFTDPEIPVHIVMEGYDDGTFTFEAQELEGDEVRTSTTWQDMPVTPQTEVTIEQSGDFSTLSDLKIDKNGDGVTDYSLAPNPDNVVLLPKAPLTVTADDKTIVLGEAIPDLTTSLAGFISGETEETSDVEGIPDCTTTANPNVAGAYPITCTVGTLTSPQYEF